MKKIKITCLDWDSKLVTVAVIEKRGNVLSLNYKTVNMGDVELTLCNLHAILEASDAEHDSRAPKKAQA